MVNKKKITKNYFIIVALLIVLYAALEALVLTDVINRYYLGIVKMICINIILATSLNLVTGVLGQLVLGHAGFMAVGAYAAAMFSKYSTLADVIKFPLALIVGGLVAGIFGIIIGIPALRLKGDYLAILTLGFGEIIRSLLEAFPLVGGASGLKEIPKIEGFTPFFTVAVISVVLLYTISISRHGRAIMSIRENEIAAEASGVNTVYYKMLAFVIAAIFAGIAGGLYAHHIGMLQPAKFNFNYSVDILVMVVLGGMGSFTGAVCSATVLTIIPEFLRTFASYRMLIYSIILIAMMLFRPEGLLGRAEFSIAGILDKLKNGKSKKKDNSIKDGEDK